MGSLSLVVLAAGMGSRYGGPKQIDPLGSGGATLLDYAAYDAWRAGFDRVVLVVREGMEREVRRVAGDRISTRIPVTYALQDRELPPGFVPPASRSKPWGTGQAALAGSRELDGSFVVANADDFYGAASYRVMAGFLRSLRPGPLPEFALLAFPLRSTLSPDGPVSRGICEVDASSHLVSIREALKVEVDGPDARARDAEGGWQRLPGATPVSLNFWGFTPAFVPALAEGFRRFMQENAQSTSAEYFLLAAVQDLILADRTRVRVLEGGGPWGGLTHPGDRPRLVGLLESAVARGEYPTHLWA